MDFGNNVNGLSHQSMFGAIQDIKLKKSDANIIRLI